MVGLAKRVLFQGFWDSVHDKCVINVDDQAALSLAQPGNGFGHEGAKGEEGNHTTASRYEGRPRGRARVTGGLGEGR